MPVESLIVAYYTKALRNNIAIWVKRSKKNIVDGAQIWSLYSDGSKSKEGANARCVLIDPIGNKTFISYRLDFECTNNTAEYEALLQRLRKALYMVMRNLMVFGDS
jgi:hypothetical protein